MALRCDDVAAPVAGLRSRGVPLMRVPDNYYVDLDARFGLDARASWSTCASTSCSTTGSGEGELLHAFTEDLGTGFHVELLERRGGYDGLRQRQHLRATGLPARRHCLINCLGLPGWGKPWGEPI